MAALSMNGEHVALNSTTLKRNVTNGLLGLAGLESQRKHVKSQLPESLFSHEEHNTIGIFII